MDDRGGSPPAPRSVRVAYLILAHRSPEQLLRLVSALPKDSPVFVHFDRRADQAVYLAAVGLLRDRPNLHFVERFTCRWGAFGIVAGTISLIRTLVATTTEYDYATLLSGTDYPIKSNREIAQFLGRNPGAEFIESFSLLEANRWSNHGGYYKTPEKVVCRHLRFRSRVIRLPGKRKLPYGMLPYGGSQWWTLTRRAITHIAHFVAGNPGLIRFSRLSFIPDESFIQIVLSNSELGKRVIANDLRFAIWDRPAPPYPATLNASDLPALLASDKLFARKFDVDVDRKIFDLLDERNSLAAESEESELGTGTGMSGPVLQGIQKNGRR